MFHVHAWVLSNDKLQNHRSKIDAVLHYFLLLEGDKQYSSQDYTDF